MTERRPNEGHTEVVRRILRESCFYSILGVNKSATEADLKRAYKRIVLEVHPDKNTDPKATEAFKKLSAAYSTLSDPDKKRVYDHTGGDTSNMYSANPQQGTRGGGGTYYYEGDVDPDEIFRMFFGGFSPFGAEFQRMNGGRNRREQHRHREDNAPADPKNKVLVLLIQFIPILLIFLSFSGSFFQSEPEYSFSRTNRYPAKRETQRLKVNYYVPNNFNKPRLELPKFESTIESDYIHLVQEKCQEERYYMMSLRQRMQYSYTQRMRDEYKRQLEEYQAHWCERLQDLTALA
jgi:DnaJ family protein B protein 12